MARGHCKRAAHFVFYLLAVSSGYALKTFATLICFHAVFISSTVAYRSSQMLLAKFTNHSQGNEQMRTVKNREVSVSSPRHKLWGKNNFSHGDSFCVYVSFLSVKHVSSFCEGRRNIRKQYHLHGSEAGECIRSFQL